ncbi:hypothetical protein BV25DRAFT_1813628, partial [Artomyces pyxidatus]
VGASIQEYQTGSHRDGDFVVDRFKDMYEDHMRTLRGIKSTNLEGYHTLMHFLYQSAA